GASATSSCDERRRSSEQNLLDPNKVGTLPVAGKEAEEAKRTNDIKTAIPLLEAIEIAGKEVSADALLTQRELADYLVTKRKAHYHFTCWTCEQTGFSGCGSTLTGTIPVP